ncbi:M48 family metallopeptidase [Thiocapsa rosea]|uniref:Peptidase M48-like protein n=1 Tax=Thiocapsa rosea TaxID=69360 RepID=A0A495VGN4_9GAMM|nr:M48 family metallopeptidase [Thiocapsa rosea]RKT47008.1 peptidase M48-like protein [Thiocapsa rosea]
MPTRRPHPLRVLLVPLLLSAALLGTGCEESPTGRKQIALVPDAQMTALGEQGFAELLRSLPLNDDPDVRAYVGCVAEALVDALPQPHGRWSIAVFDDPTPNAFALPGGKIGVHIGMLQVARTPDQLAAVIAHEIAHVLADHSNERLTQELAVQGGLMLVDLFAEEPGSLKHEVLRGALGIGAEYGLLLPYSRTHEREADRIGRDLMAQAGFNPRASVMLWRNMAAAGGGQPLAFLSTHPTHDTRMNELAEGMDQAVVVYRQARAAGRTPACALP